MLNLSETRVTSVKKVLLAVLVLLAAGAVGWALVGQPDDAPATPAAPGCDGVDQAVSGAPATLPLGLALRTGATVLDVTTQGKTTIAFAKIPGGRDDIVPIRDAVLTDLKAAGYTVTATDQEPGFEAEAQLGGKHRGTVKVSPLCTGLLEIRYKIER